MSTRGGLLGLALLAGCNTASTPASVPPSAAAVAPVNEAEPGPSPVAPTVVLFVRHAEKASDGTDDPPLTERGARRAHCLARMLAPFEPDIVLTSTRRRTRDTVAPLAAARGLTLTEIDPTKTDRWETTLRELPAGSRVVVSGHSDTIPGWLEVLGVTLDGLDDKGNIPHDDYDRLIEVVLDEHGRPLVDLTLAYCTEPD